MLGLNSRNRRFAATRVGPKYQEQTFRGQRRCAATRVGPEYQEQTFRGHPCWCVRTSGLVCPHLGARCVRTLGLVVSTPLGWVSAPRGWGCPHLGWRCGRHSVQVRRPPPLDTQRVGQTVRIQVKSHQVATICLWVTNVCFLFQHARRLPKTTDAVCYSYK